MTNPQPYDEGNAVGKIRLRPLPLDVTDSDPFENDRLNRHRAGELLAEIVHVLEGSAVIGLHSPWGTGKTTFLRMWSALLRKHGRHTILFDAWQSDFQDDPFSALVSTLTESLEGRAQPKLLRMTREAAAELARKAIPVAIRLGTGGLLNLSEGIEKEVAVATASLVEDRIKQYEEGSDSIVSFKAKLGELAQEQGPIIVLVDELDRCRPTYALELIEVAKHLFDVDSVVFVLALDHRQLAHSVRAIYGEGFDSEGYLRRFIDLDYRLPPPDVASFAEQLLERYRVRDYLPRSGDDSAVSFDLFEDIVSQLAVGFELSLRQVEHAVVRTALTLAGIAGTTTRRWAATFAVLLMLRMGKPDLYRRFLEGRVGAENVIKEVEEATAHTTLSPSVRAVIAAVAWAGGQSWGGRLIPFDRLAEEAKNGENPEQSGFASHVLHWLRQASFGQPGLGLEYSRDRIELISDGLTWAVADEDPEVA